MPIGIKDMLASARAVAAASTPTEAQAAAETGAVILDVREPGELTADGRIATALHVPRGLLEVRADPESPAALSALTRQRGAGPVHVLCASGTRAWLAAHTLIRMGYEARVIEGGLAAWRRDGLPLD